MGKILEIHQKLYLGMIFKNINLDDTTCIWEFKISLQM
jgi:hypothetical protein